MLERDRRRGSTVLRQVERFAVGEGEAHRTRRRDALATEEPLEIRLSRDGGPPLPAVVTMRTPGSDFELAAGFLYAEGVIGDVGEIAAIRYCVDEEVDGAQQYNVVNVHLVAGAAGACAPARSYAATSSCGVCGKATIEAVLAPLGEAALPPLALPAETLLAMPERVRAAQRVFDRTGGLHAAALFTPDGELLLLREDVGRHNALDKLVGASLLAGELPLGERVVVVSGRLSFELVQKAVRAGVPVLAGVSAPSSLAVELAERAGLTLVGFLRESTFNVYAGGERIASPRAGEVVGR